MVYKKMKTLKHQNSTPTSRLVTSTRPANKSAGSRVSMHSSAPNPEVEDPRTGRCCAKENTCLGFHTKNSNFCAGHEKAAEKALAEQDSN
jgi:hypothetical protein